MEIVGMGIAGLCFGVLSAHAQVPRLRLLPFLSVLFLLILTVAALFQSSFGPPWSPLVFLVATIIAASLYSAQIWRREGLGSSYTFWQLVWTSALHPGRLRAAHRGRSDTA